MELSLVGLQNAGKTSLVNAIAVSSKKNSAKTFWYILWLSLTLILWCSPDRGLQWGHDSNCKYHDLTLRVGVIYESIRCKGFSFSLKIKSYTTFSYIFGILFSKPFVLLFNFLLIILMNFSFFILKKIVSFFQQDFFP